MTYKVRKIIAIVFISFVAVADAQPPQGTTRIEKYRGYEVYRDSRGHRLGSSNPNANNGRSYYDNHGQYSRSYETYNGGTRFVGRFNMRSK